MAPTALNGVGVGTSHWVLEVLRVVDIVVLVPMLFQAVICFPAVRHDDTAWRNVLLTDRKQHCCVATLHYHKKGTLVAMPLNPTKHLQRKYVLMQTAFRTTEPNLTYPNRSSNLTEFF